MSKIRNYIDIQEDKKYTIEKKTSKIIKVRTFSDSLWYVALVRTNCEQKTSDIIGQFDSGHRVNVWVPNQKVIDKKGQETYRLDIHGYVFFHLPKQGERNARTRYETLRKICSISYVYGLLTDPMTQSAARIPNLQVQRLKDMLNDFRYPTILMTSMVQKGLRVKVVSGTLAGVEGTVADISKEKSRIYIAFDCLGCAVTVIDTSLVVPVNNDKDERGETNKHRQVSMEEWLMQHPYREALSDDRLYVHFANSLIKVLADPQLGIPLVKRKQLAQSLTSYIEDKRTHLGLFADFVEMRYKGMIHPLQAFYEENSDIDKIEEYMENYDSKKVNVIDLMYFLQNNYNGKPHSLDDIHGKARLLMDKIEQLDYTHLPLNSLYATTLCDLLQNRGLKGLKRLMEWIAQRFNYFSYGTFPVPDFRHIFCSYPQVANNEPLSIALQLSKRLKAKIAATRKIEAMLNAPVTSYKVVGCYKKAIHLMGEDGKRLIVYLDEISGSYFAIGERYECKLIEIEENKWYMLKSPLKEQA